jgi:hypothetical protein
MRHCGHAGTADSSTPCASTITISDRWHYTMVLGTESDPYKPCSTLFSVFLEDSHGHPVKGRDGSSGGGLGGAQGRDGRAPHPTGCDVLELQPLPVRNSTLLCNDAPQRGLSPLSFRQRKKIELVLSTTSTTAQDSSQELHQSDISVATTHKQPPLLFSFHLHCLPHPPRSSKAPNRASKHSAHHTASYLSFTAPSTLGWYHYARPRPCRDHPLC